MEQRNKVRGLAHDRNVAKVTLVEVPDRPGVARAVFAPLADAGHQRRHDRPERRPRRHDGPVLHHRRGSSWPRAKRILEPIVRELGFREMTTDSAVAKVSIVGRGHPERARATPPGCSGRWPTPGVNIEMISTCEIRITCIIAEDQVETAVRALHAAFALERPESRVEVPRPASEPAPARARAARVTGAA